MDPVTKITAGIGCILGILIIGIGGTYWYLKDKAIISSGPGATFNFVVWKCFGTFALIGAFAGYFVGGILGSLLVWVLGYWYILALVVGWIVYVITDKNMNKALVVGGIVAVLGFCSNSYLQSEMSPSMKPTSKYTSAPAKNNLSAVPKSSASNGNTSNSKKKLFDGSQYGLNDLTPDEQAQCDLFTADHNGDPTVAYNWITRARARNGGKPIHFKH